MYADVPENIINPELLHPGRSNVTVGPLMSPEINSLTVDDKHNVVSRSRHDDGMLSSSSSSACSNSHKKSKKKKKHKKHKHKSKKSKKRERDVDFD